MPEMVERVARALADSDGRYGDAGRIIPAASMVSKKDTTVWELFIPQARAAIEAMREPTDAMEAAGNEALSRNGLDSVEGDDSTSGWQAMIHAALE